MTIGCQSYNQKGNIHPAEPGKEMMIRTGSSGAKDAKQILAQSCNQGYKDIPAQGMGGSFQHD